MARIRNISRFIPRRYRFLLIIILILCPFFILFISTSHSPTSHSSEPIVEIVDNYINVFDLFDDDDRPLICPSNIQFNITNRRHLTIILGRKLASFIWINFRALLCSGIDAYVMLDEVFLINSSLRVDDYKSRTHRSQRSYSHRFLYVPNRALEKYGVNYMNKLPSIQYTSWDRAIVWLYHRANLTNVWVLEHDVQWFDVRNMIYLFDSFANDTTDLLCDNIVPTNSPWGQWPRIQSDIFPKAYWTGTFSPLVRWSRRLLQHHYRYMKLMHKDRLKYEIDRDYRFQEFIMATIAKIEHLSMKMYSDNANYIHIVLGNMDDRQILANLRYGKYILHPVKQNSILTNYRTEDLAKLIRIKDLKSANMTLLEKEIIKQ